MKIPVYSLEHDHAKIKQQIKEWEKELDRIISNYYGSGISTNELENLSHEMMSINL